MREEKARRKAEFRPGIEVRLADGQVWSLPVPTDHVNRTSRSRAGMGPHWDGPTYRLIIDAVMDAEDQGALFRAEMALAIHLLDWNYALDPDDFEELLDDRGDFQRGEELRSALHTLALAHAGPAGTANGDDPQKALGPRRNEVRPPINQYVAQIFGRLRARETGGSADLPA